MRRRLLAIFLAVLLVPFATLPADPLRGGFYTGQATTDAPSYVVAFNVAATAAMDIFTVLAQANKVMRLRRIVIVNPGNATAAIVVDLQLGTVAVAGSGGTTPNALAVDQAVRIAGVTGGPDPANSLCHTGDTTQGSSFVALYSPLVSLSVPTAATGFTPLVVYDARDPQFKPITTGNGLNINLRTPAVGAGAAGLRGYAEFTVTDS